ncbi:hypothetical protein JOC27_002365 [Sporolactobacillus spathodeae]|uniref:Uncharacterized protein n=1 Tax=Sporolactobacillus spathodeae TaxID=1465502 RepID=A0ABS2QD88_9BACL|nr:hypothetical protein [Sporolactobacillus spathodeae]
MSIDGIKCSLNAKKNSIEAMKRKSNSFPRFREPAVGASGQRRLSELAFELQMCPLLDAFAELSALRRKTSEHSALLAEG